VTRVAVVGGPHDGAERTAGPLFRLVGRGSRRALYQLVGRAYVYAGHLNRTCACGALVRQAEGGSEAIACPLCGSPP